MFPLGRRVAGLWPVILLGALIVGCTSATPAVAPTVTVAAMSTATAPIPESSPATPATLAPSRTARPTDTPRPPTASRTLSPTSSSQGSPAPVPATLPSAPPRPTVTPALVAQPEPTVVLPSPGVTAAAQARGYGYVASLVISPEVPPTYYVLIGDGIYRSTDRGATWLAEPPPDLPAGAALYSLALDYRAPETLYATSSAGIYVRRDGAWALVNTLPARSLAVDLQESHVLWAGVFYSSEYNSLVLRSDDAGRTWSAAGAGLPGHRQNWVAQILIDPANPGMMYANVRSTGRRGWPEGWLYRGGRAGSWEPLPLPTPIDPLACMVNGLALDPREHRLWVGCDAYYYNKNRLALARSENYDQTDSRNVVWESLANLGEPAEGSIYGYVRALAADAGEVPSRIFVALSAGPGGVGAASPEDVLVTRDASATWEPLPLPAIP